MKKNADLSGVMNTLGQIPTVASNTWKFLSNPNGAANTVAQSGMSALENGVTGLMGKVAPFLTLPIAYGLLNGHPQAQQAPAGQPMANYGSPIQSNPIIPQYFGQDKTAGATTPALILGTLHRKAVTSAINQLGKPKDDNQSSPAPTPVPAAPLNIQSADLKTQKLMAHPEVKEYINNLLNN